MAVEKEDGTTATVEMSEGMAWTQIHSQLEALGLAGYYLEYTDVVVVRELMVEAERIFEQLDDDRSGALDRSEIEEQLALPTDKGGHWGFSKPQVEEFIRAADEDGSGSIDAQEFRSNASFLLLCSKDESMARHAQGHKLAGLSYSLKEEGSAFVRQKPLRVKCRHEVCGWFPSCWPRHTHCKRNEQRDRSQPRGPCAADGHIRAGGMGVAEEKAVPDQGAA